MNLMKSIYILIFSTLFVLACDAKNRNSGVFQTVFEIRNNFQYFKGKDVNLIGFLIRLTDGKRNQDYLLLDDENHAKLLKQGRRENLGLFLSSFMAEENFKIDDKCIGKWVEVSGLIGYSEYSIYHGNPSIKDYISTENEKIQLRIHLLEDVKGSYECKWIKKQKESKGSDSDQSPQNKQ